jgi:hypothetical protein
MVRTNFFPDALGEKLKTMDNRKVTSAVVFNICREYEHAKKALFFGFFSCFIAFEQSSIASAFRQLFINNPEQINRPNAKEAFSAAIAYEDPSLYLCNHLPLYFTMTIDQEARQRVMDEKKGKLTGKINALIELVKEEVAYLKPLCRVYHDFVSEQHSLESTLNYYEHVRDNAKKFYYDARPYPFPGYTFARPNNIGSDFTYVSLYIPDDEKRLDAREQCRKLQNKLYNMEKERPPRPEEYDRLSQMSLLTKELEKLKTRIYDAQESELASILEDYKQILNNVTPFFLDRNTFNRKNYLPISEYAEYKIQTTILPKAGFFSTLAPELQEHIASMVVSSNFSEKEKIVFR